MEQVQRTCEKLRNSGFVGECEVTQYIKPSSLLFLPCLNTVNMELSVFIVCICAHVVADVEVMECLQRPFDVSPCSISIPDLGFGGEQCRDNIKRKNGDKEWKMQSTDKEVP